MKNAINMDTMPVLTYSMPGEDFDKFFSPEGQAVAFPGKLQFHEFYEDYGRPEELERLARKVGSLVVGTPIIIYKWLSG